MRKQFPRSTIELWAQDEARIGLIPTTRRVWAKKGERPTSSMRRRYEWTYLSAFVRPTTGAVQWLLLPTMNTESFSIALEHFAKATGAGKRKQILIVVDGAGWHHSATLRVPNGLHFIFLPAYSPELQPAERLWPLAREAVANRSIDTIDELDEILVKRCRYLSNNQEIVRSHTLFHWWKALAHVGTRIV